MWKLANLVICTGKGTGHSNKGESAIGKKCLESRTNSGKVVGYTKLYARTGLENGQENFAELAYSGETGNNGAMGSGGSTGGCVQ